MATSDSSKEPDATPRIVRWTIGVLVATSVAAGTAVAADPLVVTELTGLVPNPSLPVAALPAPVTAASDGGDEVANTSLPSNDPGLPGLKALLVGQGAQATVAVRRAMSDGGATTSFATAFPSAAAARASERRVVGAVLATPGATTGLNAELENSPGGRIAIAVGSDGTLRIIAIAARGARLVGTVTTKPGAPAPDLTPYVVGIDASIARIAPVAGATTAELGVSDALRLAIRAAWAASGRTGAEIGSSMLAATVDGTTWVMADMGAPGTPDVRLFRALSPTSYQLMGQVAFSGACPAIPVSLREVWGYASECAPDDAGQPLPGTQPLAPGTLPEPAQGNGQWIWMMSRSGSIASIVARARANGLRTLYIKSGDGRSYWTQFDRAVGPLKAAGLRVCAWQYVLLRRPEVEAAVAARAVRAGADCFVIDAETELERYKDRYKRVQRYMRALRARVGPTYPIGMTSFPYVDYHGPFPYTAFFTGPDAANFNMPQVYWKAFRTSAAKAVDRTIRWNRIFGVPMALIGSTYMRENRSEITSFRCAAQAAGVQGVSWWEWKETRPTHWSALGNTLACRTTASRPATKYPVFGVKSRGDYVRRLQQLLLAAGVPVPVDGVFGTRTAQALATYRTARGLAQSPVTDDGVWADLLARTGAQATSMRR